MNNSTRLMCLALLAGAVGMGSWLAVSYRHHGSTASRLGGGGGGGAANSETAAVTELTLYCAAGLRIPVDRVVGEYKRDHAIEVRLQYGGSGQLLANIELAKRGDLYLAADDSYVVLGRKNGLLTEAIPLATQRPVIVVAKGNPRKINGMEDLLTTEGRIALANPDQAAVGKVVRDLLTKSGQWEALAKKVAVFKPTVNDTANDLLIGSADAAIVWDTTAAMYPQLEVVHAALLDQAQQQVSICVLRASDQPTAALRFARYLAANDRGLKAFKDNGFVPVPGDVWEEEPTVTLYCGALNRIGVKDTIARFEQREGCRINTVYNGCGILVSQIKAGQVPDAYLACDTSFVPPVADLFLAPLTLTEVPIVIATPKGNPKNIKTVEDLTRAGLKIGLCHAEQSSVGALTKRMLTRAGLYEQVHANTRSETPTADTLVNQMQLGSLDAVVVSRANVAAVPDKVDFVPIPGFSAVQPYTISKQTPHAYLVTRLREALTSTSSRQTYEKCGFIWRVSENHDKQSNGQE